MSDSDSNRIHTMWECDDCGVVRPDDAHAEGCEYATEDSE